MKNIWTDSLLDSAKTLHEFITMHFCTPSLLESLTNHLVSTLQNQKVIFTAGNGGSYCQALHFTEELTGRYRKDRIPLASITLGEASHITCVSNDYSFKDIFSRQLQALGKEGDCLILYSTSGNSENLLEAAKVAKDKKVFVIGLLGRNGGKLKDLCDLPIIVPGNTSDRIQDLHSVITHIAIETIERSLFSELYK